MYVGRAASDKERCVRGEAGVACNRAHWVIHVGDIRWYLDSSQRIYIITRWTRVWKLMNLASIETLSWLVGYDSCRIWCSEPAQWQSRHWPVFTAVGPPTWANYFDKPADQNANYSIEPLLVVTGNGYSRGPSTVLGLIAWYIEWILNNQDAMV